MKHYFVCLLMICFFAMSLQPYDPCYAPPPILVVYYYKNGKLIKKEKSGNLFGLYGNGVKNSPILNRDNKTTINTDSFVVKIK